MKKQKSLHSVRTAVGMAIATLLTTCLIGGTFAKYIAEAGDEFSARVAYWGFGQQAVIDFQDLFAESYTNVQSGDHTDVIAPGTSGQVTFKFPFTAGNGATAPEVAYTFCVDVDAEIDPNMEAIGTFRFKLDDGIYGPFEDLVDDLLALSGDASGVKTYAAGQLPTGFSASDEHTIYWKWDFTDPAHEYAQDLDDTDVADGSVQEAVRLDMTITATQID